VIVSEETGRISLAVDGNLYRNVEGEKLKEHLMEHLKLNVVIKDTKNKKNKTKQRKGKA